MKPIIGITLECTQEPDDTRAQGKMELNWNYAQAVADAGGLPMLIPPMADVAEIANLIDGWLIPGGRDIDAKEFGQDLHPMAELQDPARFNCEKALFEAVSPDLPVLGICYGCQFVNVIRGGTLQQHLPDVLEQSDHEGGTLQVYAADASSKLAEIVDSDSIKGKSYHHQAVDEVGEGLNVVARHEDGTIEALEDSTGRWMIGVQWHPERTPDDEATQKLFTAFVEAARAYRKSKSRQAVGR